LLTPVKPCDKVQTEHVVKYQPFLEGRTMAETGERAISRWHIVVACLAAICVIAEASTGVSKKSRSLVDCLISRKMPSTFADRAILAAADTHTAFKALGAYRGTRDQNLHLVEDLCPGQRKSSFGYGRKRPSRESYATAKSPDISWELYNTIRQAARDTARNHGLDEEKFLQLIGCESAGFDPNAKNINRDKYGRVKRDSLGRASIDRGLLQINNLAHPEVSDEDAYNWRKSLGWGARTAKVEYVAKKGEYKGQLISQAAWWYCYKKDEYLGYGIASIRAQPKTSIVASTDD
jgi:hypothetical protein